MKNQIKLFHVFLVMCAFILGGVVLALVQKRADLLTLLARDAFTFCGLFFSLWIHTLVYRIGGDKNVSNNTQ